MSQELTEKMIHGQQAIENAKGVHILPEQNMTWDNTGPVVDPATPEDLSRFIQWLETLTKVHKMEENTDRK